MSTTHEPSPLLDSLRGVAFMLGGRDYALAADHVSQAIAEIERLRAQVGVLPEMVEVLTELLSSSERLIALLDSVDDEHTCDTIANVAENIADARAALAKAK